MPFQLQNFPDQEFLYIRVDGDVSMHEYGQISQQYWEALDLVRTNVDVMVDLRGMQRFPTAIGQLRKVSMFVGSPKVGWIILLTGDRPLLKRVATVLCQLQARSARMRVFDTLRETVNFLQGIQPGARYRADWFNDFYHTIK